MKNIFSIVCASSTFLLLLSSTVALADYEDGVEAAFSGDYDTAFKEFTIAAEEGLSLAQFNLGILYFTGQGVEQDFDEPSNGLRELRARSSKRSIQPRKLYLDGQGTQVMSWRNRVY